MSHKFFAGHKDRNPYLGCEPWCGAQLFYLNEWQAFYDAVYHGKAFPSTAEQCYIDQVVITAMLDSALRREVVVLK
jgi:hypothetical protein